MPRVKDTDSTIPSSLCCVTNAQADLLEDIVPGSKLQTFGCPLGVKMAAS